eukprot:360870-Chlamydomonas_euryale.AAC.29
MPQPLVLKKWASLGWIALAWAGRAFGLPAGHWGKDRLVETGTSRMSGARASTPARAWRRDLDRVVRVAL